MANDLTLSVRLTGDGQQLTGTLQAASGEIRQFGTAGRSAGDAVSQGMDRGTVSARGFSRATQQNSRELQALRRLAAPLGAALAGVFATRTLQNQIAFGDRLLQLNTRIGAGVEALSEYQYVADQAGVAFDTLATAWQRQTRRVAEAAQGTGAAKNALEALNLSAETLNRLAPEDAFERIAEALESVESQADRTALAMQLWDTEGVALLQIVNQGTDAIRTQRDEAERLGLTISQDTAVAMAGYSTEMSRLQAVGTGLSRQLAAELVPALTSGLQTTSAWVDQMGGTAEILDTVTDAATGVAIVLAGRYAGAIAASQAALTAKAAIATTATGTLNLLTGATTRQAAAATAMAGANRVAASALALFGGPVGVAVVAAGALYYFREELNGTATQSRRTTERVDDLTNAINTNSEAAVRAQLVNLTGQMFDLERQAISAREALDALSQDSSGGSGALGIAPGRTGEQARAIQELGRIAEEMDAVGQSSDRLRGILEALRTEGTTPLVDSTRDMSDAVSDAATAVEDAAKESADFAGQLKTLRDRLQPARAAQIQAAQSMNTLTLAYASGRINLQEYLDLVWQLQEAHIKAANNAADVTDIIDTETEAMATLWERRLERMDDAAVDMWRSFIDGSEDAFGSFRRLAIDTLAEVIHAYTTQQITASLGLNIAGNGQPVAGGGGVGGTGGMGSVLGAGRNIWNSAQQGFGSVAWGWGGASNTAYAGGWAGSATSGIGQSGLWGGSTANFQGMQGLAGAGAGLVGGWAGNQVFGSSEHGGTLSAIGGTIGAYWGPIGSAIGSFIGSGLGSLVGHKKTPFRGEFVTRASDPAFAGMSQAERRQQDWYYGGHVAESALGTLGFTHRGSQRVHRAFDMDAGHDESMWAQELANAAAEMDNFLAALVDSDDDVQAMADAVQSLHIRSGDASKVIEHALVDRPLAAMEAVGLGFGERITDAIRSSAEPQEAVESLMAALSLRKAFTEIGEAAASDMMLHINHVLEEGSQTLAGTLDGLGVAFASLVMIDSGVERLNLQFDSLTEGAIHAAWAVQDMAGGVENLAQLQTGYYQTYFSEVERAAHLQEDLTEALGALNLNLPESREGFRRLVEAQDLNTAAGQEAYVALLGLASGFDQLQTHLEGLGGAVARSAADIANERYALETALLRIQGNTEELRARELEGIDESNRALQEYIWALEDHAAATAAAQQAQQNSDRAAAQARQEWERAVEQAQRNAMSALQSAYQDFVSSVDAERRILEDAYSETTQSINDNIDKLSRSMSETERAASSLGGALDRMLGRVPGALGMQRAQGQAYLREALSGTGLGDPGELDKALRAVSEPSEDLFETFVDYQRDFYRTARDISDLEDRASGQLSASEQARKALEEQLDQAEVQHNSELARLDSLVESQNAALEAQHGQLSWLQTVNGSVLSIADAINALEIASNAASNPSTPPPPPSSGGGGSGGGGVPAPPPPEPEPGPWIDPALEVLISRAYRSVLGRPMDREGAIYWAGEVESGNLSFKDLAGYMAHGAFAHPDRDLDDIRNAASWIASNTTGGWDAKDAAIAHTAIAAGLPSSYLARALGQSQGQLLDRAEELGIPAFASGGYHSGGARIVGERGPELEITGPSHIVSNRNTQKLFDITPLIKEIQELKQELRDSQRAIAEHTRKSARVLEREEMERRQQQELV